MTASWSRRIPRIIDIMARLSIPPGDRINGCWEWANRSDRYPKTSVDGRKVAVHRYMWEYVNGPVPDGMHVLHSCDNPLCGNPRHLFIGTHTTNMQDKIAKGRGGRSGGAPRLTEDQVRAIRRDTRKQRIIAEEYGVSRATICQIRSRRTWAHLKD